MARKASPTPSKKRNSTTRPAPASGGSVDITLSKKQLDDKRRIVRATKIDWAEAYKWYLEDVTRTYLDVAKHYDVASTTVERQAKITLDDGSWMTWAERRVELGEIEKKKAEDEYRKSVPARNEEHLKQYRNLQVATSRKITMLANQGEWVVNPKTGQKFKIDELDARQLSEAAKALKISIDGERVVMGMATSIATIKPGSDDETGKGWGELLALAIKRVDDESRGDKT